MNRFAILILLFFAACSEPEVQSLHLIGKWANTKPWDKNQITLELRDDSVMIFRCVRQEDSLTRQFLSAGHWQIAEDSFLVMTEMSKYWKEHPEIFFKEELSHHSDSMRVVVIPMQARLQIHSDTIFDVNPDGTRSKEKFYTRLK
ncbi:MAG: hypothetical protein RL007_1704 [Bacteroidota bacterium]|jgi:hypothetical protein